MLNLVSVVVGFAGLGRRTKEGVSKESVIPETNVIGHCDDYWNIRAVGFLKHLNHPSLESIFNHMDRQGLKQLPFHYLKNLREKVSDKHLEDAGLEWVIAGFRTRRGRVAAVLVYQGDPRRYVLSDENEKDLLAAVWNREGGGYLARWDISGRRPNFALHLNPSKKQK